MLSESDVRAYRAIFDEQSSGHFAKADLLIKKVKDPALIGYALEQRYLGRGYISKFAELKAWLAKYGDLGEPSAFTGSH